jgi:hypothetical protein
MVFSNLGWSLLLFGQHENWFSQFFRSAASIEVLSSVFANCKDLRVLTSFHFFKVFLNIKGKTAEKGLHFFIRATVVCKNGFVVILISI